jgi:hypothetical protein
MKVWIAWGTTFGGKAHIRRLKRRVLDNDSRVLTYLERDIILSTSGTQTRALCTTYQRFPTSPANRLRSHRSKSHSCSSKIGTYPETESRQWGQNYQRREIVRRFSSSIVVGHCTRERNPGSTSYTLSGGRNAIVERE